MPADEAHAATAAFAAFIACLLLASPKARKGLFTHEDNYNFHKVFGFACMLSYAYRFAKMGERDMGFAATNGTLASIILHMTLSVSSLIFKIPRKRTLTHYRIWPEYRLHSIVFAWRSLLTMLVVWVEGRLGLEPMYPLNTVLTLLCFATSDYATRSVGDAASASVRELNFPATIRFLFSTIQFHGTFDHIIAPRRYSTLFVITCIIQVNAFLMTIQRKNLLSSSALMGVYGVLLVLGFSVKVYECNLLGWTQTFATLALANVAALARMSGSRLGANKYVMWALIGVVTNLTRHTYAAGGAPYENAWLGAFAATTAGLGVVGYRKVSAEYYEKSRGKFER